MKFVESIWTTQAQIFLIMLYYSDALSTTRTSIRLRAKSNFSRRPIYSNALSDAEVDKYSFNLGILGDLHLDPRNMVDHDIGRQHVIQHLRIDNNCCIVSLGDLGIVKSLTPDGPLFSGTTACFKLAKEYLEGFSLPFEIVAGNHDLEGIDEFSSDEENLQAFVKELEKSSHRFCKLVAEKTLIIGMSTSRFRDAPGSSHEVYICPQDLDWFENILKQSPASDGWRILVFTHAPPMGSGLRVLQGLHVKNGCAWLNHAESPRSRRRFIELVKQHPSVKAWFSGHFHLGQDYEDSISIPASSSSSDNLSGNNEATSTSTSCVFVQTGVIGTSSSRDKRRQSRIVRGNANGLEILTVNHHKEGELRLDATITYDDATHESIVYAHPSEDYNHLDWVSAYTPEREDGCYLKESGFDRIVSQSEEGAICWWHMEDGAVLGVHDGVVMEYDSTTLAPLGLVVDRDQLGNKEVAIVGGTNGREQALVLCDAERGSFEVIHPNEDGSYWRRRQKNKIVRVREKRREAVVKEWAATILAKKDIEVTSSTRSSDA